MGRGEGVGWDQCASTSLFFFFSTDCYFLKKAQRLSGVTRERSRDARTPRGAVRGARGRPVVSRNQGPACPRQSVIEEDARCSLKTARRRKQCSRATLSPGRAGKKKETKYAELMFFSSPLSSFVSLAPAKRNAFESRRLTPSASSVVVRCRRGEFSLPAVIVFSRPHTASRLRTRSREKWRDRRREREGCIFLPFFSFCVTLCVGIGQKSV